MLIFFECVPKSVEPKQICKFSSYNLAGIKNDPDLRTCYHSLLKHEHNDKNYHKKVSTKFYDVMNLIMIV